MRQAAPRAPALTCDSAQDRGQRRAKARARDRTRSGLHTVADVAALPGRATVFPKAGAFAPAPCGPTKLLTDAAGLDLVCRGFQKL